MQRLISSRVPAPLVSVERALVPATLPIKSPVLNRLMAGEAGFEFFRTLDIELELAAGTSRLSFVTLSVDPHDGRSTVALLFALQSAALAPHMNVLYVDASDNRDHLSRHISLGESAPCFYDLMDDDRDSLDILRASSRVNLSLVRGGSATRERVLFSTERFATFIERAKKRFDRIIIDPPPLAGRREALAMIRTVPDVLLVCRCRHTSRHRLRLALRDIASVQGRVLGQVLNRRAFPLGT